MLQSLVTARELSVDQKNKTVPGNGLDVNIAIVGGGASGLTLAYALEHNLGHRVTVFEGNSRVGGKVFSPKIGDEVYDVGAVLIDSNFTKMLLDGQCRLPYNDTYMFSVWDTQEEGNPQKLAFIPGLEAFGFNDYIKEIPAWIRVYNTYKYIYEDPMGFFQYERNRPLYVPFDEFIKENGIETLGQAFRNSYVLYGYGFGEDVPAMYILKFMLRVLSPESLSPILAGAGTGEPLVLESVVLPGGGQALFECLASTLRDVRLSTTVKSITRGKGIIQVETGQGDVLLYDRVVITTDLLQALSFLDAREDEFRLFSSIRHNIYISSAVQGMNVPDFPNEHVGIDSLIFPYNMYQNRSMFPQGLGSKPLPDNPSVTAIAYQYDTLYTARDVITAGGSTLTPIVNDSEYGYLEQYARQFLNKSGISFDNIGSQYIWPTYFPHFGSKDLGAGAYKSLASLQGRDGTYYAGSLFNFETIQGVTDFAIALAKTIQ